MSIRWLSVLCGLLLLAEQPPGPTACLQTLPTDGTWGKYQVAIKIGREEVNAEWVARSVGQATNQGALCRWIELEQSSENDKFPRMTWRCLVPESEFGEGKHPIGKAVKVWQIVDGQDPVSVDSIEERDKLFGALIKGPEKEIKTEALPETIRWQRGNLECQVISGDRDAKLNDFVNVRVHHRIFRHVDAPFQLGGVHWSISIIGGDEKTAIDAKMTLQDTGTDAKAKYPDLGI